MDLELWFINERLKNGDGNNKLSVNSQSVAIRDGKSWKLVDSIMVFKPRLLKLVDIKEGNVIELIVKSLKNI